MVLFSTSNVVPLLFMYLELSPSFISVPEGSLKLTLPLKSVPLGRAIGLSSVISI